MIVIKRMVCLYLALTTLAGVSTAAARSPPPVAHAARSMDLVDTVTLRLVRKDGSVLYQRGNATGTLPGRVTARFQTGVIRVSGTVTIFPTRGGSVTINVAGNVRSVRGARATFNGTMGVRDGSGPFAKAYGGGTFTGVVNRSKWNVTVNARARITY